MPQTDHGVGEDEVEAPDLPPHDDFQSQNETAQEGEKYSGQQIHEEWEEGPGGENDKEDDDDYHVRYHPGENEEMFVDHCSEEEEEGKKKVETDASNHPEEDRPVLEVEQFYVGEDNVRHLKKQKLMLEVKIKIACTTPTSWELS